MRKRSKLSKYRQQLVVEYIPLAKMLAKYFVQHRQYWQRSVLIEDLESEGLLGLTKAARTYDKTKLPYPKAYFARAILNGMLKYIKKATRQPGINKISLQEAADMLPEFDELDHLRLAIDDMTADDKALATDRFIHGQTLRTISEGHQIPLRTASLRSARLAKILSGALDIRLKPHAPESKRPSGSNNPGRSSSSAVSGRSTLQKPRRSPGN